jgi:hypothetical protein
MNQGKYVFSQIVTFLPGRIFDRCVLTYGVINGSNILLVGTNYYA